MADLDFQNISTVQSGLQPGPRTIASATTIAPTTFLTVLTGTTAIATVTPPVTGTHVLCFTSQVNANFDANGNVAAVVTMAIDQLCFMVYNPTTAEYTGGVTAAT